jgi:hypothetical protein
MMGIVMIVMGRERGRERGSSRVGVW